MSKPDWKDAPRWANWLGQDWYGAWGWYQKKPRENHTGACWDIEFTGHKWKRTKDWKPHADFKKNPDWRNTLESRPQ